MEAVTKPKKEYEYLKRLELVSQDQLLMRINRGLKDAASGKLRER